jgi:hypothetical protein
VVSPCGRTTARSAFCSAREFMTRQAFPIAAVHILGVLLVTLSTNPRAAWPSGVPCPPPPPPPVRLHQARTGVLTEDGVWAVPLVGACRTVDDPRD